MSTAYLTSLGLCCALGASKEEVWQNAILGSRKGMQVRHDLLSHGEPIVVGEISEELPKLNAYPAYFQSRNNQLAALAYQQIASDVEALKKQFGKARIGIVIGTSTSGIAEGEKAIEALASGQVMPASYQYQTQEMSAPADFIATMSGVTGPCYAISTACSSSARALMSAKNLLQANLVDAVIVGGVDSLCRLTINGFHALESTSKGYCQPFSANRDGINIGEAAALFIMQKCDKGIALLGVGASSDAHHMSAPHPEGRGAIAAISKACEQAGITPSQLGYINLHGTATPLNDSMESYALAALNLHATPASSTKAITGHTLGAAGALEAALCWLTLSDLNKEHYLIPHVWDKHIDESLPKLHFVGEKQQTEIRYCLSNSFAFGGNNMALILGKTI